MKKNRGQYEILFRWSRLDWLFEDQIRKADFYDNERWRGAIPAGFKTDQDGNYYVSVPRWKCGIPATMNRIEIDTGKPMLAAYPNWEMNEIGNPNSLQSVLGWEIDENNRAWFLDQGHIEGNPSEEGAQKIVCWDITNSEVIDLIHIPSDIASYTASFLNDLVIDNANGFVYIADSGIYADPLEGGLVVFNTKTKELRRVLHQHQSTQDNPNFQFEIAGRPVSIDGSPMRTGADGIALSADRNTLYWCPLTGRRLYAIDTAVLQDFSLPLSKVAEAVHDLGDKGTTTDGMGADNKGYIYYTMLEGLGIGIHDPKKRTFTPFVTDDRMIWVDGLTFDNQGHMIFNSNRLHQLLDGDLDWEDEDNMIVWKAFLGHDVKSYMYRYSD